MLHVAICKGPSRNILMPLEAEQVWTSVWHTQRKSLQVRLGGIQTLGLSLVSLVRIYDLFIVAAWNKLEDVDELPLITASITRLPFIHVRSVGNQTAYSEDGHVNSVAPGTSSGWEEPKRTKRNCNAIIRKTHENINEHHGKHGLPCRWWVLWLWQPLYTLFILMNSEIGVFEHVLVKTTELPYWLNEVCKARSDHIVTLLNEKELHNTYCSNWKSTSLNIWLKIVWKTFANNESWSEPWRYQNTCMIIGVIGTGLQSPRTNNFTHFRVEQVGAWPRTTLPLITTSTMRFHCHWFMSEALQATTIQKLPTVRTTIMR